MGKVSQFYSKEHIQQQACLWVSRIDRGLSATEKKDLAAWLSLNKVHHNVLLEMASYWDDLSVLNELSGLFPLEQVPSKATTKYPAIAIAASLVLVALLGTNLFINNTLLPFVARSQLVQTQTFKTKIGEQASFAISDGTTIQLNTNSVIKVAYTPSHRQLILVRGEARLDVAKEKTRPFTVTVGEQSFTALGTIFNVQKNNDQAMELVVTEGRVLITKADKVIEEITQTLTTLTPGQLPGILVTAGEKAVFAENVHTPITKVPLEQLQRDLAWQQGMLIFEGEPLALALTEVSRYTATKFEIVDPQLADIKVAGYFKAGDIDGLLASLNSNFNIVSARSADNTILLTAASE